MNILTQEAKKKQAIDKYAKRNGKSQASRIYGVSLSSVKRWCKKYDGTWQSMLEKSHRPHSHPKRHTPKEEKEIKNSFKKYYARYGWDGVYDDVSDDVIPQPDTESINNSVVLNTNHSELSASEYYQLSSLSGDERTLYLAITDAIAASESIVDVSKLSMNEDQVVAVFQKVLTDYPQFFYVSRSCILAYRSSGKEVRALFCFIPMEQQPMNLTVGCV